MGFSAAGLLPLVAIAAIPVVIHILSRLRLKRASFPSLMLLSEARRERFSWIRVKELLLLILRTLALLFLLLAITRPFVKHRLPGLGRARDVVIVLDDSYSMGLGSRWQQARTSVAALLRSLGSDRRATLLRTSTEFDAAPEFERPAALLFTLDSLAPSFTGAVLEPALRHAIELARPAHADVVAVTDLQQRAMPDTWQPPADVPVTLVDVGGPAFDNAGVVRVDAESRFPVAGQATRIVAEFANYGANDVTRTAILTLDDKREENVVSIPARGRASLTFETTTNGPGSHVARVELRSDSLAADDVRWQVLSLPQRIPVLVIQSQQVPARFVQEALGTDSSSLLRLTTINEAEFGRYDPRDYAVVVVTDAGALTRPDWTRLGFALQAGGAALVMAGNAPADSAALAPYVSFRGTARPSGFVSVTDIDTTNPVLSLMAEADFQTSHFFTHGRINPQGADVVTRLSDDEPLIVEAAGGRLLVWATSPAPDFTDLVYKAAFVPLLHRSLLRLASALVRHDYPVGDTVILPAASSSPVAILTPGRQYQLIPVSVSGRPEVRFGATDLPGIYTIADQPVAVNVLPGEGDLTRADPAKLIARGLRVASGAVERSSDLVPLLLWLAALAFAAELLLLIF
jgi:hypothetical protein